MSYMTDEDERIITAVSVALEGKIGLDDDVDRLQGFAVDELHTACEIAVAFIRFAQDLKTTR